MFIPKRTGTTIFTLIFVILISLVLAACTFEAEKSDKSTSSVSLHESNSENIAENAVEIGVGDINVAEAIESPMLLWIMQKNMWWIKLIFTRKNGMKFKTEGILAIFQKLKL